ncbi:MAG: hypothetical protein AAGK97_05260 [Bacteroidota bacterium]
MIDDARILTLHPQGKKGVNIIKSKYDFIASHIIRIIKEHEEITFQELSDIMEESLSDEFDGKIIWYVVTVKLDLEARSVIERIPKTSPHKLRLKK